jgi:hypothetical protein
MLGWLGRFFLVRFLPRRLIPILTVIEVIRFIRGLRRPPQRTVVAPEGRVRVGR